MTALLNPRLWGAMAVAGALWWVYSLGAASVQREWDAAKAKARADAAEAVAADATRNAEISAADIEGVARHVESTAALETDPDALRSSFERLCEPADPAGIVPTPAAVPAAPAGSGDAGRERPRADHSQAVPAPDWIGLVAVEAPRCVTCCDRLAELQAAAKRREWADD